MNILPLDHSLKILVNAVKRNQLEPLKSGNIAIMIHGKCPPVPVGMFSGQCL